MDFSALLQRLEQIPALAGKIAVSDPAFMEGLGSAPYLWIVNVQDLGGDSPIMAPVRQRVECRIECLIGDRDFLSLVSVRDTVRAQLVNFQTDSGSDPIQLRSGQMESGEPGWFLWRDAFSTAYFVDAR